MSETLAAEVILSITPPGGLAEVNKDFKIVAESYTNTFRRQFTIPANQADFAIALPLATVSLLLMTGNVAFNYKLQSAANNVHTCRKVAMHTPNAEVLTNLYITTGASALTLDVIAAGA